MILIIGPIVIVAAFVAIILPRLFWLVVKLSFSLVLLVIVYVVDGQSAKPWFPHAYEKSAAVR
jgi:hypothetical protein